METILKADIFFFVTTISVVVMTIVGVVVGIYAIKILHDVRVVVRDVKFKYGMIQKFIRHFIK